VRKSKNISLQPGFKPRTVQSLYRLQLCHPKLLVVLEESAVFVFKGEPTLKMEAAGLAITIIVISIYHTTWCHAHINHDLYSL
jgi:hypothetical protein